MTSDPVHEPLLTLGVLYAGMDDTALSALAALKLHLQRMHADSELASHAQKVCSCSSLTQELLCADLHDILTSGVLSQQAPLLQKGSLSQG